MKLLEGVKQPGGMLKPWLSYIRTHIKEATFSIHLIIPPLEFSWYFETFINFLCHLGTSWLSLSVLVLSTCRFLLTEYN
jgi:hypothetical protein